MAFIWDPVKAADNIRDHHVKFEVAEFVFDDPRRIERHDDDSSDNEERWQTIGMAPSQVLFVVYTEVGDDDTRLISARLAEPKERRLYHGIGKTHSQGWFRVNP
ncbi:hypothetical protein AGMMS49942_18660 [Spirochaetia bacterium]|nr:hypothetical protein AGMMS49942_18660 [Spirochaetia bacterium]